MKIYDISQEVFHCEVWEGDPSPSYEKLHDMDQGEVYNLSAFSMGSHNGTHVDAPAHFIKDGKTIDQINLEKFVGPCYVVAHEGSVTKEDAAAMLKEARRAHVTKRLLIKGKIVIGEDAAKVFADAGLYLIGNETQTFGPVDAPMAVHKILLTKEIVLLEGVRLKDVRPGRYLLNAAPLNLGGLEGSPCRAWLMEETEEKPDLRESIWDFM